MMVHIGHLLGGDHSNWSGINHGEMLEILERWSNVKAERQIGQPE